MHKSLGRHVLVLDVSEDVELCFDAISDLALYESVETLLPFLLTEVAVSEEQLVLVVFGYLRDHLRLLRMENL